MPAPKGNQFAIGNSGREKMFKTVEDLQSKIDEYFEFCDSNTATIYDKNTGLTEIPKPIPYTIEGLCEVLDCDRLTLLNYQKTKGYEEYFNTIKKAKLKIQKNKLERGLMGDSQQALTIFDLKNNHGYTDESSQKVEVTNNISGEELDNRIKQLISK